MLTIDKHTTTADLVIVAGKSLQALFDIALLNGASITDDLVPGTIWQNTAAEYPVEPVVVKEIAGADPVAFPVHGSLVDTQVAYGGFVDTIFETALLNGLSITDEVSPGTLVAIAAAGQVVEVIMQPYEAIPVKQVQKHQSMADFVLQHTGALDGLFDVAILNGIAPTTELQPGTVLSAGVVEKGIADYFMNNNLQISSDEVTAQVLPGGIGFMQIQTTFKVS